MARRFCLFSCICALVFGVTGQFAGLFSVADEQVRTAAKEKEDQTPQPGGKKVAMKAFMRKKLEASQNVLEGLAVENFDLISQGARQLKATSAAAEFMVHDDPLYKQHADDFRRIVTRLEKAAKEQRLEASALSYIDMTMSCIECHKFVRNMLIAN
jgi:hypothetical protein